MWRKEVHLDGTRIQANADWFSNMPNFEYDIHHQLNVLFPDDDITDIPKQMPRPERDLMEDWVQSYQEKAPRIRHGKKSSYQRLATRHV